MKISHKLFSVCIVLLFVSIFAGCTGPTSPGNGYHLSNDVYIRYVNEKGEDLLNPDHAHAITEQNTNLYYVIDGKKKKIFKGNLDSPKMFNIGRGNDPSGFYTMQIYANTPRDQDTATTYVAFKDYPQDTLKVRYISNSGGISVTHVWYNGKLRMDKAIFKKSPYADKKLIVVTKHLSEK